MLRPGMNEHVSYAIDDARVRKNNSQWAKIRIKVQHSLLDNAPNYVGSWLHYPKEISCNHNLYSYYFLHFFSIFSPLCITKLKAIVPCHIFCTNLKIITVL